MRRFTVLFIFMSGLLILSFGCDGIDEVIIGPGGDSLNTVINLEVFENIDRGLTNLEIHCQTDSFYHCSNFLIEYDLTVTANNITLTFTGINEPTFCFRAFGPATAIVNLGALANITYAFSITVDRVTVPAQLILTDSTIEIIGGDSTWTDIVRPLLYRVPANTIWGEVGYSAISKDSALTFFDSLISIGATPKVLATGYYGYFYIDSTNAIDSILKLGPSIGTDSIMSYIYHYTGDTTALSNLVQAYAAQVGSLVRINVNTSDGYQFRSY